MRRLHMLLFVVATIVSAPSVRGEDVLSPYLGHWQWNVKKSIEASARDSRSDREHFKKAFRDWEEPSLSIFSNSILLRDPRKAPSLAVITKKIVEGDGVRIHAAIFDQSLFFQPMGLVTALLEVENAFGEGALEHFGVNPVLELLPDKSLHFVYRAPRGPVLYRLVFDRTEHGGREWEAAEGKKKIRAEFLEFKRGKVVLVRDDGRKFEVSPHAFSVKDQAWVREELRRRKKRGAL